MAGDVCGGVCGRRGVVFVIGSTRAQDHGYLVPHRRARPNVASLFECWITAGYSYSADASTRRALARKLLHSPAPLPSTVSQRRVRPADWLSPHHPAPLHCPRSHLPTQVEERVCRHCLHDHQLEARHSSSDSTSSPGANHQSKSSSVCPSERAVCRQCEVWSWGGHTPHSSLVHWSGAAVRVITEQDADVVPGSGEAHSGDTEGHTWQDTHRRGSVRGAAGGSVAAAGNLVVAARTGERSRGSDTVAVRRRARPRAAQHSPRVGACPARDPDGSVTGPPAVRSTVT